MAIPRLGLLYLLVEQKLKDKDIKTTLEEHPNKIQDQIVRLKL